MELKSLYVPDTRAIVSAFNRTAYGIEITFFRVAALHHGAFNRTAYGIEIPFEHHER